MEQLETKFNREINLHPANHLVSSLSNDNFDVIIIGSGQAGRNVAARIAAKGASCLIIEDELVGGDCPFWACVPSKGILRPSEALDAAKAVGGAREQLESHDFVSVEGVFARRDGLVNNWDDSMLIGIVEAQKIRVVRGMGRISAVKEVTISAKGQDPKTMKANMAVIVATGSKPCPPEIPGLMQTNPWGPRQATSSQTVPDHLVILGAGVVGCEMATAYSKFGGKVTMISSREQILAKYHPEAARRVKESLAKNGVSFIIGKLVKVEGIATDEVKLTLSDGSTITGSKILITTGRQPRTGDLGLENVGVSPKGALAVDESMCVHNVPGEWLYGVGDVNGRSPLTHMALYQAKIAGDAIIARSKSPLKSDQTLPWTRFSASADHDSVPQVVFTDPTVATVGLSLTEATKRGLSVKEVTSGFPIPGAWLYGDDFEPNSWAQWVVDTDRNLLVGATFVGRDVTDLLHASTVAIVGEVPLDRLKHAVPSFPTRSEVYASLIQAYGL